MSSRFSLTHRSKTKPSASEACGERERQPRHRRSHRRSGESQRRECPQRRPHHRRRRAHHRRRRSLRRDLTKPDVVATKRRVEGEEILGPFWTSPNGIPTGLEGSGGLPTARPLASGDGDVVGGYVRAHARRTHLLEQSVAISRNQSQSVAISRHARRTHLLERSSR